MSRIIGVQFQKNGKMFYFDANGFDAENGEYVIVDTVRGADLAEVVFSPKETEMLPETDSLKKVIRVATEQDLQRGRENRKKEKEAFGICQKKIAEHKLEMKLVSVEYAFDGSKIMFYFTANGRVDFRSLVKDLASVFKMRIELRQIGVRDEAKMLGGLGPCGRPICCGTFLSQFQPVSIKMAKEQNLSLNPTKISGVCGRLMCCLKYEQDHYEQTRKRMPKVGRIVDTPDGSGPVTELNIVKETVFVRLTNGDSSEIREYPLEELSKPQESITEEKKPESVNGKNGQQASQMQSADEKNVTADEGIIGNDRPSQSNSRNRTKNHQLGQPVKRENPNRPAGTENAKSTGKDSRERKKEYTEPTGRSAADKDTKKAGTWADAVQNAMRAIDKG